MQILVLLVIVLVFVIIATAKFKMHPFISLMISAIFVGLASGIDAITVIKKISEGFGNTLSSIGIIIALGAIIGAYLEKSGGTKVLANSLLKKIGEKRAPLAMNLTGLIVSIPVFCDSGFVILSSLNKALSKRTGIPLAVFAIALSTGLYVSHVFVPPTPGPLAAAAVLNADLGLVMILGLIISIPTAIAGLVWAKYIGKSIKTVDFETEQKESETTEQPSTFMAFAPILLPVLLIGLRSVANYPTHPLGNGLAFTSINFLGSPIIALFIGLIIASFLGKNSKKEQKLSWVTGALKEAGVIILVTGAGGAFGNILRASNIGEFLGQELSGMQAGILLPFIIAAILKTAQGSSTVAIITTAAIISPLMEGLGIDSEIAKALAVLSIGAGAMTVSHINDSYFWVVSQFSHLDIKSALKSHTIATLIQGVTAIILISIINMFF
jgi:GntP family gluconate:H+ symporter